MILDNAARKIHVDGKIERCWNSFVLCKSKQRREADTIESHIPPKTENRKGQQAPKSVSRSRGHKRKLSRHMTKPTKWHVRPAKTDQPGHPESSLCAQWVAKDLRFLQSDSEDSDQTGRMPRTIWVLAGCTGHFVCFVMKRLKCQYDCFPSYS